MVHFLVTRFNLKVDEWKVDRENKPILNDDWLAHRFELFQKYCLPSVKNQNNQNFKWLVFFDNTTPEYYIKLIHSIKEDYVNFTPFFIDGNKELNTSIVGYVQRQDKLSSEELIITTRIDNDDIIHQDFIKEIQELGKEENMVVDLRCGYQMVLDGMMKEIRVSSQEFNPFLSIVQLKTNYISIFSKDHPAWKSENNVIVSKKRLWIQLIHGRNKLNRVNRHNRLVSGVELEKFGYNESMCFPPKIYVDLYNNLIILYEKIMIVIKKKS